MNAQLKMKILRYILLVFMCLNLSGCVTYMTVQKARGEPEKNKEGKSEATEDPKPLIAAANAGERW